MDSNFKIFIIILSYRIILINLLSIINFLTFTMKIGVKLLTILLISYSFVISQPVSISGTASVNMIKPLSITSINSVINFGEIVLSGSPMVVSLDPSRGANFRVEGHPNRNVVISYSVTSLTNSSWVSIFGGTVGSMNFSPNVVHTGASSSYSLPVQVANGSSIHLVASGGIGVLFLWVGGTISISSNQPAGDYNGTFNLIVAY